MTEPDVASKIAGLSVMKGVVVYGATLTFAGLYAYFIHRIVGAKPNTPPKLDTTLTATAAALAGVLGSAFALVVGIPTDGRNGGLAQARTDAQKPDASKTRRSVVDAEAALPGVLVGQAAELAADVRDLGICRRRLRGLRDVRGA